MVELSESDLAGFIDCWGLIRRLALMIGFA